MLGNTVRCPDCHAMLKAGKDERGQETDCPRCGTRLKIPNTGNRAVPIRTESPKVSRRDAFLNRKVFIETACPHCGKPQRVSVSMEDQEVQCKDCDEMYRVPKGDSGTVRLVSG